MSEAEKMAGELFAAYRLVSQWPEKSPDGFMNLLALRNMVPDAAALIRRLAAENAALKAQLKQEQEDHSEMLLIAHLDGLTKNREAHAKELAAQAERVKRLEEALRAMLAWSEEFAGRNTDEADARAELLACQNARAALEPRETER